MSQREELYSRDGGHQPHRVNLSRDLEQGGGSVSVSVCLFCRQWDSVTGTLFLTENAGSDVSTWVHLLKAAAEDQERFTESIRGILGGLSELNKVDFKEEPGDMVLTGEGL